jgi:hypothetical protein
MAHQTPDGDLAEVAHILPRLPLLDPENQLVGVGAGEVLVAVDDVDPRLAELIAEVARLIEVPAREAGDVEHQDEPPGAVWGSGLLQHPFEASPGVSGSPAHRVVLEPQADGVAVAASVGLDRPALVSERLLLPVGGAPQVAHGGLEGGCLGSLVQQAVHLTLGANVPRAARQHPLDSRGLTMGPSGPLWPPAQASGLGGGASRSAQTLRQQSRARPN